MSHQARFLISMYVVVAAACFFIPEARSQHEDKFDVWQLRIQNDGYPKMRYIHLVSRTTLAFTYTNSNDCSDLKVEVRRFFEPSAAPLKGQMFGGTFEMSDQTFEFPPQSPIVQPAASLLVVQTTWAPTYFFYSALIKADHFVWKGDEEHATEARVHLDGFVPMFNIMMDLCHAQYTEDNPTNAFPLPMYSQVTL